MKYLFYLGHPAHYHNLKNVAVKLAERSNEVIWVARDKDVLFKLLEGDPFPVIRLTAKKRPGKLGLILFVLQREFKMLSIALKHRPDLMAGTDIVIAHIGRLLRIPSVVINEDDLTEVPEIGHMGVKYASANLAPESCVVTPYEAKTTHYKGFQELSYLSPKYFTPDRSRLKPLGVAENECFFILRFAELSAYHDDGNDGLNDALSLELINLLQVHGKVFITSERPLKSDFESYRIQIDPRDIHHALYYAHLYIGDSQTMAAEAAILGTPSIRMNDFVGRLGYLEELEHNYQLTYGVRPENSELLIEKTKEWLSKDNIKEEWRKKSQFLFKDCIDVCDFFTTFLTKVATDKVSN